VRRDRLTLAAFAVFVVIAGAVPVAIRLGSFELPPLWAAGLRFGVAAAILAGLAIASRAPFPRGAHLLGAVLSGLLFYGGVIPLLLYVGLSQAPAAVGSIAGAFDPPATLMLAALIGLERLTLRGVAGALVAAAGIGAIVGGTWLGAFSAASSTFAGSGAIGDRRHAPAGPRPS
jgi:drug/metabolite transporter (DMT)-like permease